MKRFLKKIRLETMVDQVYYSIYPEKKGIRERAHQKDKRIADEINRILLEEGLIKNQLPRDDILKILDSKWVARTEFKPDSLLSNYELIYLETCEHLGFIKYTDYDRSFIKKYNDYLLKRYPKSGYIFFVVLRKQSNK